MYRLNEKNRNIIYKELSYKIIGIAYDIFDKLGPGHKEQYYQKSFEIAFKENNIKFQKELYIPLVYKDKKVGKYFFDFLIENKIIAEIKRGDRISRHDIKQLYSYLKSKNLKLGLIIRFTSKGVVVKRIVNLK